MTIRRAELVGLGFVVLSFAAAAFLYNRLPERVPTHWNSHGVVDGFMPKPWGALVLPLLTAGIYALYLAIPRISPRGYRIERFQTAYDAIHLALLGVFFVVGSVALLVGAGVHVPIGRVVPVALGVLFMVIGNFMGKLTKNFFVGIRTPWTLANDEVWLRTHRLGGRLFALAGLVMTVAGLFGVAGRLSILVPVAFAAVVPVVYSYVLYRKLERSEAHPR